MQENNSQRNIGKLNSDQMEFNEGIFHIFRDFIEETFGIFFEDIQKKTLKKYLIIRMNALRIGSFEEYYDYLMERDESDWEYKQLAELITVNETYFFRVPEHFDFLEKDILPEISKTKNEKTLNIWSAGCSTGEEPYSLAITILENMSLFKDWNIKITGTDISLDSLEKAKKGYYHERPIKYMRPGLVKKYFDKINHKYKIKHAVKSFVDFKYLNLIKEPFEIEQYRNMDIIFFRNVMIYFKIDSIKRIISNFYRSLNSEGILFIGPSETLWKISEDFKPQFLGGTFVYRKIKEVIPASSIIEQKKETNQSSFFERSSDFSYKNIELKTKEISESKNSFEKTVNIEKKPITEPIEEKKYDFDDLVDFLKEEQYEKITNSLVKKKYLQLREFVLLIVTYLHTDNRSDLLDSFEKYRKIYVLSADVFFLIGMFYKNIGDYEKALEFFNKTLYIQEHNIWARYYLANLAFENKNYTLADREYKQIIISANKLQTDKFEVLETVMQLPTLDIIKKTSMNNLKKIYST